tara:strand:- start:741 stop:1760 length:1020 start_codon:yes stop_codon:yes gene_type:complete
MGLQDTLDLFLGARVNPIQDRQLSNRSLIRFMYPKGGEDRTGEIGAGVIITLPFFENVTISESQTPRWSKHDILGRNGQLFTFTGSQSRNITLNFDMTIPHISESNPHPAARYISGSEDAQMAVRKSMRGSLLIGKKNVEQNVVKPWEPSEDEFGNEISTATETVAVDDFGADAWINDKEKHTQSLVTWWVNVIRTSTLNNGQDPRLGPPVIMLKHGPLYQDAKFVCQKYDIGYDENAGYESSLISRKIKVSMDLLEVKHGSGYEPGRNSTTGDALTGWQDLLEHGTLDPANDTVPALKRASNKSDKVDPHNQNYVHSGQPKPWAESNEPNPWDQGFEK